MRNRRRQGENGQMLQRIIALLFALADLAEAASLRCPAVRRTVLWILYPAEAVTRRLVLDVCGPVELAAPRNLLSDDGPDEALRLATCFRILALMLAGVPDDCSDSGSCHQPGLEATLQALGLFLAACAPVLRAQPFPDTS